MSDPAGTGGDPNGSEPVKSRPGATARRRSTQPLTAREPARTLPGRAARAGAEGLRGSRAAGLAPLGVLDHKPAGARPRRAWHRAARPRCAASRHTHGPRPPACREDRPERRRRREPRARPGARRAWRDPLLSGGGLPAPQRASPSPGTPSAWRSTATSSRPRTPPSGPAAPSSTCPTASPSRIHSRSSTRSSEPGIAQYARTLSSARR